MTVSTVRKDPSAGAEYRSPIPSASMVPIATCLRPAVSSYPPLQSPLDTGLRDGLSAGFCKPFRSQGGTERQITFTPILLVSSTSPWLSRSTASCRGQYTQLLDASSLLSSAATRGSTPDRGSYSSFHVCLFSESRMLWASNFHFPRAEREFPRSRIRRRQFSETSVSSRIKHSRLKWCKVTSSVKAVCLETFKRSTCFGS
jgi:hypothetical protein